MLRQRISLHVDDSAKYLDWRFSCLIDSSCIPVQSTMASSDSSSNRSLWSACGINVYVRRLFRAVQRSLIALGVELRYCTRAHTHTHTHNSFCAVQRSLIALGVQLRYCTHTHNSFCAVQRSLIALGVELRYCTHKTLSCSPEVTHCTGSSAEVLHTRLFLCSPEVAHCTGGWAEVLHTHDSFCAV